jgi:hypothetical protein
MNVRYRVELNQAERDELTAMLSKDKRAARKLKRVHILLAGRCRLQRRADCAHGCSGRFQRVPDQAALCGRLSGTGAERGAAPRGGAQADRQEALLVATACANPPEGR